MKLTLTALFVTIAFSAGAQSSVNSATKNGIYLSPEDFLRHRLARSFEKNDSSGAKFRTPPGHLDQLWLKISDSTYKYNTAGIWGYRKDGEDWRVYHDKDYQVVYMNAKIVLYRTPPPPGSDGGMLYFFSKSPGLPINDLSKKDLMLVYSDNLSFVRKVKKIKWYHSVFRRNKKTHRYLFIDWL